ncbi:MAG: RsmE family RNA methyltransferase [Bryobacteraceae bacterium]|nr:RsmE family RNA methyltransferase [Bryobacteraceae bacterium]
MARRLFFVPQVHRGIAELEGEDAKHLTRVLRVEPGQTYQLSDNESLYLATVEEAHKSRVSFRVVEKSEAPEPKCRITLAAALIKFDHFEWTIEKATELGVSRIVPVETVRSEAGLERAAAKRIERWRKIALEASQQSRRARLPEIADCVPFEAALRIEADLRLFADEEGGAPIHEAVVPAASVVIAIGPEGGWTEAERAMAAGWTRVSLGPNVLRAETAALAAMSVISSRLL